MNRIFKLFVFIMIFIFQLFTADVFANDCSRNKDRWEIIPAGAPYYTPDTNWAIGAYIINVINPRASKGFTKPDEITFYFTATLKKQFAVGIFPDFYLKQGFFKFTGNIEASRYPGSFWGIGPNSRSEDEEKYTPGEFFTDANLLVRFNPAFYAGPSLHFKKTVMEKTESGGLLDTEGITGSNGTLENGLGFMLQLDTRDSTFYPEKGLFAEGKFLSHRKEYGSRNNFTKTEIDFRGFAGIYKRHVIAFQLKAESSWGDVPFKSLSSLGGSEIMRGLFMDRYMDKSSVAIQAEYRFPFTEKFGSVIFAGAGEVQDKFSDYTFQDIKPTAGAGLRYYLGSQNNIPVRLDAGFGEDGLNVYFLVKEAF